MRKEFLRSRRIAVLAARPSPTTLLEAGAVGLGAVSMAILGGAAADVSGLFAASVLAGVGATIYRD